MKSQIAFYTSWFDHTLDSKKGNWCVQVFTKIGALTHRFKTEKDQTRFLALLKEKHGPSV